MSKGIALKRLGLAFLGCCPVNSRIRASKLTVEPGPEARVTGMASAGLCKGCCTFLDNGTDGEGGDLLKATGL